MAVFTSLTPDDLSHWLQGYDVGTLVDLQGISSGIENTNYFVTTTAGRYVLTLFEKLTAHELPFYIHLMAHLAHHGVPCPAPVPNRDGAYLGSLKDKPAALVSRLKGASNMSPGVPHCAAIGDILARLHLAGQSYDRHLDNPRGARWRADTAPHVLPFLPANEAQLLRDELDFQQSRPHTSLPRGVIHADLFRDNCLFEDHHGTPEVGGIIDFYFAGEDALLLDIAITVNDWCSDAHGALDAHRTQALLSAYHRVRPLHADEHAAWPALLRAGALRFWISRLYDLHLPREGEMVHPHDPARFRDILRHRIDAADTLPWTT